MAEAPPKVVKIIDGFRLVINRGRADGISNGDRFLIYQVGDEILDPDTNESLGKLEVVKGHGQAKHVQDRLAILESLESERIPVRYPFSGMLGGTDHETRQLPYNDPQVGDIARPLQIKPRKS